MRRAIALMLMVAIVPSIVRAEQEDRVKVKWSSKWIDRSQGKLGYFAYVSNSNGRLNRFFISGKYERKDKAGRVQRLHINANLEVGRFIEARIARKGKKDVRVYYVVNKRGLRKVSKNAVLRALNIQENS